MVLSHFARWVQLLIAGTTKKCVKKIAAHTFIAVRREFSARLRKANQTGDITSLKSAAENSDSDSDDEVANSWLRLPHNAAAAITVEIGTYSLLCLNTRKQMVIAVDDAAVDFIRNWLLPLALQAERTLGEKASTGIGKPAISFCE